jgi:hypothetical protein
MKTLLAVLIFLLAPALACASPITFGFSGTIFSGVADSFSGFYTFDYNAASAVVQGNTRYVSSGGPYGMTIFTTG